MCSGSRSSVQKAIRDGPYSSASGTSARRLRAADASRISNHIPARSRSRPSSTVEASWSDADPGRGVGVQLALRGRRARARRRGGRARASRARTARPRRRPGSSSSRRAPSTRCRWSSPSRSPIVSSRHGDSNDDAGTHDEAMKYVPRAGSGRTRRSASARRPCRGRSRSRAGRRPPPSFPSGSTSRANSSTSSFDDSRCTCASTKPGTTYRPVASSVSTALVAADAGDDAVYDRDVSVQPLARERREDAAAADHEVGGLVASRDRESSRHRADRSGPGRHATTRAPRSFRPRRPAIRATLSESAPIAAVPPVALHEADHAAAIFGAMLTRSANCMPSARYCFASLSVMRSIGAPSSACRSRA